MTALVEFLEPRTLARRHHPGDVLTVPAEAVANLVVLEMVAVDLAHLPAWWPAAGSLIAGDVDDLAATA